MIVCPAEPRRLLLQSAYFAGVLHAPLFVIRGDPEEPARLRHWLKTWQVEEVHAVGAARVVCAKLPHVRHLHLADEQAVKSAALRKLTAAGPVSTLIVVNPADSRKGLGAMSCLAPWLAANRRAALLLTNEEGDNVPAGSPGRLRNPDSAEADNADLAGRPAGHSDGAGRTPWPGRTPSSRWNR